MKESDVQILCGCSGHFDRVCPQGKSVHTYRRQCAVVVPEDDLFRIVMDLPEFKRRYKMSELQEGQCPQCGGENGHHEMGCVHLSAGQGNDPQVSDSTDDDRVRNNVMRHEYRTLSDDEKAQMQAIKDLGLTFVETLTRISNSQYKGTANSDINPLQLCSRELSLAKTKIEEAVMWAVKHVTG